MLRKRASLAAILLLIAAPVFAQRFTAAIRGTVTDPSAAAVAGAKVTLTNENTGLTRGMTTNAAGNYSFDDLPVGSYKVEVEFAGFKSAVRSKVVVNVADVRAVNIVLETGAITESVSVVADSASVKTVGAEIAGLVTGEQVRELPLNGRNFLQLTLLQPGVTANQDLNTVNKGLAGGSDISVSGGSTTSNLWLIDGADNVDHGSNRTIMVYPSVDAIEEFKIQRNNYGAEFGQAGGAQINLVTRGGTNTVPRQRVLLHPPRLAELEQLLPRRGRAGEAGAQVGRLGRARSADRSSRTSCTSSFRTRRTRTRKTSAQRLRSDRGRACRRLQRAAGSPAARRRSRTTRSRASRSRATSSRPTGSAPRAPRIANLYQLPNNNPSSGCNNYVEAVPAPVEWDQINARMDWTISNSTRVMVRYTQDSWMAANTILWGDSNTSTVGSDWDQPGKSLVAQLNQNIGSTHDEHPDLLLLGQQDHRDPDRNAAAGRHDQRPAAHGLPVERQAGGGRRPAALLGRGRIRRPLEPGPLGQQPGPVRPQGRLLGRVREALHQGRRVLQHQRQERVGQQLVAGVGGLRRLERLHDAVGLPVRPQLRQRRSRTCSSRAPSTARASSSRTRTSSSAGTTSSSTWPTPTRSPPAGRWTSACASATCSRRTWKTTAWANFVQSSVNPASANSSCNGLEYPPGTNPCAALGIAGGSRRSEPLSSCRPSSSGSPRVSASPGT